MLYRRDIGHSEEADIEPEKYIFNKTRVFFSEKVVNLTEFLVKNKGFCIKTSKFY